jgi:hypothetical protein
MIAGDMYSINVMVTDMTQELKFEKTVLIGTALMALFLFVAQGMA